MTYTKTQFKVIAQQFMKSWNVVTSLQLKNTLRTLGYEATQKQVSDDLSILAKSLGWNKEQTGSYFTYTQGKAEVVEPIGILTKALVASYQGKTYNSGYTDKGMATMMALAHFNITDETLLTWNS
jgi:hypothetical protein